MAYAPRKKIVRRPVNFEPELVPFIDMLVVCCCFLLVSASLLQTGVLKVSLPGVDTTGTEGVITPGKGEFTLALVLTGQGYRIGGTGSVLGLVPKENGKYDWPKLETDLADVKKEFPEQTSITIISEPEIIYDDIIQAMDRCAQEGFGDISLAGDIAQ